MKESDPEFWKELTQTPSSDEDVIGVRDGDPAPEDDMDEDDMDDDSEIPTEKVVEHVVHGRLASGVKKTDRGDLVSCAEAETAEPEAEPELATEANPIANEPEGLGRGKRRKFKSTRYSGEEFWEH